MKKINLRQDQALRKVWQYIRQKELIRPGQKVLAAVSGGADSVCLFLMLHELKDLIPFTLEIVTVNHGIRGERAADDVAFVEQLGKRYQTPVIRHFADVPKLVRQEKLSEEEAARKLRYECIFKTKAERKADLIAVGHHMEDQAETVLHNLFRGSGLAGLSGMQAGPEDDRTLIRPLLCLERREIEAYLAGLSQDFCTDETNLEDDYTRNRLRHHVIPMIREEINPEAVKHIAQAGELISQVNELLEELAEAFVKDHVKIGKRCDSYEIDCQALSVLKPVLRKEIFHRLAGELSEFGYAKDIGAVHLEQIDALVFGEVSKKTRIPGNVLVEKGYGKLVMSGIHGKEEQREIGHTLPDIPVTWEEKHFPGEDFPFLTIRQEKAFSDYAFEARVIPISNVDFAENNYTKCFDYDKIKNRLSLRCRCPGDYFILESGGKKSLKSYLIDQKIPSAQRDFLPLLADGEHILWIGDGRISAAYKVREDTRRILQLKISSPNGIKEYGHE